MNEQEASNWRDKLERHDNYYDSGKEPNMIPPIDPKPVEPEPVAPPIEPKPTVPHKSNNPYAIEQQKKANKKPKGKMIFKCLIMIVMFVLVGFFAYDFYEYKLAERYDLGYADSTNSTNQYISNKTINCIPIPVSFDDNLTLNLIALECLNKEINNG